MPNKKVRYFKSINEIKKKIVYINDKDFLGYDTANIFAFTFNLYKLKKFGVSNNFIYMEDDFFIGKPLKKSDFFYYDNKRKKVLPYVLSCHFKEMNKTERLNKYYKRFKIKDTFHPHSSKGWRFTILNTDKYFIERYNISIIIPSFTHNAIAENLEDLKKIFKEIQNYEYINYTLFAKERHILSLNQPHFVSLYQLNINHRKVHSIPFKYFRMESINKVNLNNIPLFVINTDGKEIPTKKHYEIQKKIMEKRFPIPTKYEIINNGQILNKYYFLLNLLIFIKLTIFKYIIIYSNFKKKI